MIFQELSENGDDSSVTKKATLIELKEIANGVRKILSPFYKNRSIKNKVTFEAPFYQFSYRPQ